MPSFALNPISFSSEAQINEKNCNKMENIRNIEHKIHKFGLIRIMINEKLSGE
jgi:hypothetical protein